MADRDRMVRAQSAVLFALELTAAGADTQIVAARGALELHEARELEPGIIVGIGQGRTRVVGRSDRRHRRRPACWESCCVSGAT